MRSYRQMTAASLGVAAIALPNAAAFAATKPKVTKKVVTKSYTGDAVEADRWGPLQVKIVVRKTTTTTTRLVAGKKKTTTKVTRRITGVSVPVYPNHTDRSVMVNQNALPMLVSETLKAQSANIDLISRATDSSGAFVSSLRSALAQVK